jgi:hypothetical protein
VGESGYQGGDWTKEADHPVNPFVFLVGCPRSGTARLRRLADAHPQLAIIPETRWIPHLYERRKGLTPNGLVTPNLVSRLLRERRFARLGIDQAELERLLDATSSYAGFVSAIFDLYGQARGKRLVGDRCPGYVCSIPTLHALWPDAKFVHLIRDGRDVVLSAVAGRKASKVFRGFDTWKEDPWTTAALWWEHRVRVGRETGRALPHGRYGELYYEELLADPEGECRGLCAFLGLRFESGMLHSGEARTSLPAGASSSRRRSLPADARRDRRTKMRGAALERFEAASASLLDELGYPRASRAPGSKRLKRAAAARRAFGAELIARGCLLPEGWD